MVRQPSGPAALVVAEAAGFGAAPIHLVGGRAQVGAARLVGSRVVENEHYRVEVLPDGTLDVLHRASGRRMAGGAWFEDEADRGDEYNFCPVEGDTAWDSRRARVRVRPGLRGPAVASLVLEIDARLPIGLHPDRRARRRRMLASPIQVEVRLISGLERVELVATVENRAEDHRLRVVFPSGPARQVRVEGHYAVLRRPVGAPAHGPAWKEPAAPTHHTLGAVEAAGVVVMGRGLPEYEARLAPGGTEIALTLLRCTGWLSRDDLSTRPDHACPPLATPEAQCPGRHRFEYALALVGEMDDADLVRASHDYRFGLLAGPAGVPTQGPLQVEGEGFCLGALKGAEDGDGCILRLYNPGSDPGAVAIRGDLAVEPCRMDEETEESTFDSLLPGGRIATFRLRPNHRNRA